MAGGARSKEAQVLELRFPSNPKFVAAARAFVEQAGLAAGLAEADAARVVLAVGEAVSNVIRHCYEGACEQDILLGVVIRPDRLELNLQDYGRRVRPEELRSREPTGEEVRPGGLGLHIIREVMDQVDLSFVSGTGNRLTMVKFLSPAAGGAAAPGNPSGEPAQ
jgi:anti-sigma regulatory factor (Ser/Thr protein kinase)